MAYMSEDLYECDFCGVELGWDETHDTYGDMWECEECGRTFCSRCLKNAIGEAAYYELMRGHDKVLCPDCARAEIVLAGMEVYQELYNYA